MTTRDRWGWVVLVVCLVLVGLLAVLTERWEQVPIAYVDAGVGARAHSVRYDGEVRSVAVTQAVRVAARTEPVTTPDRFVVVEVTFAVHRYTATFQRVRLLTRDGSRYTPHTELTTLESCPPGFTASGHLGFEVPRDRVAGARLLSGPEVGSLATYDTALRFDLGLTDQTAVRGQVDIPAGRRVVTP